MTARTPSASCRLGAVSSMPIPAVSASLASGGGTAPKVGQPAAASASGWPSPSCELATGAAYTAAMLPLPASRWYSTVRMSPMLIWFSATAQSVAYSTGLPWLSWPGLAMARAGSTWPLQFAASDTIRVSSSATPAAGFKRRTVS